MRAPIDRAAGVRSKPATALKKHDKDRDPTTATRSDKCFQDAAARFAIKDWALSRTNPQGGTQAIYLGRLGLVQRLSCLEAVQVIPAKIGG